MTASPLAPFAEYLDMCRRQAEARPAADRIVIDVYAEEVRDNLADWGLDLGDPMILAAILAGIVEAGTARREIGTGPAAALTLGWAILPLAAPFLVEQSVVLA